MRRVYRNEQPGEPQAKTSGESSFGAFSSKTNSSGTNLNSQRLARRASYRDVVCKRHSPDKAKPYAKQSLICNDSAN